MSLPVSVTPNKSRDEDEKEKRLPERQISSPSAFSTGKVREKNEDEKDKDEKQSETHDDLRQLPETHLVDFGGVSSSERLLPSSSSIQDTPAFTAGVRRVIPVTGREEDTAAEGAPGTENKGRRGTSGTSNVNYTAAYINVWETQWPSGLRGELRIERSGFEHCPGLCVVFLNKTLYSRPHTWCCVHTCSFMKLRLFLHKHVNMNKISRNSLLSNHFMV